MNAKKITIAIDGYSSCGKSTLAKQLAQELSYIFIDSGAMYRGVTLFALERKCISNGEVDANCITKLLDSMELRFQLNTATKAPELYLNGTNVEQQIRTPQISALVSKVAVIKEVRDKLVREQRTMGQHGGIVMDGRDIGSVVFPNAELKLFITAALPTRVERRYQELTAKGIAVTPAEVEQNLLERDHIDSTREISPLTQAKDAIVIDNTHLSKSAQLATAIELAEGILMAK